MEKISSALQKYEIVCPHCMGELEHIKDHVLCTKCDQNFPIIEGIIDLRFPQMRSDKTTINMLEIYNNASFEDLLTLILSEVKLPPEIIEDSLSYYRNQEERAEKMTAMFLNQTSNSFGLSTKFRAVDLGCGSGAGILSLVKSFEQVIGVDTSMPQLLLGKKSLEQTENQNFILICASADAIPLRSSTVNYIQSTNVLEHLIELPPVVEEISRVLCDQGVFAADSRNKYDVFFPEPHTGLRFLGFLPWKFIPQYVQWRCKSQYEKTRLLSYHDLNRYMRKHFTGEFRITFPDVQAYGQAGWIDRLIGLIRKIPLLRSLLLRIFTTHILIGKKVKLS